MLIDRLNDKPKVAFSYFQPDERKDGGAFLTVEGIVKKLDGFERLIILQDGAKLQMDNVIDIDGEIFKETVI